MKTNVIANSAFALAAASVVAGQMVTVKVTSTITVCDSTTIVGGVATGSEAPAMSGPPVEVTGVTLPIMSSPTTTLTAGASSGEAGGGTSETGNWPTFTPAVSTFSSSTLITPGVNGTALLTSSADAISRAAPSSTSGANASFTGTFPGDASSTGGTGGAASTSGTAPIPTGDAGTVQMQGSVLGLVVFCVMGLFLF